MSKKRINGTKVGARVVRPSARQRIFDKASDLFAKEGDQNQE